MSNKPLRKIFPLQYFVLFFAIILIIINSSTYGQSDSTEFDLFSINDGPYVIQQSNLTNIVFYVCEGFFESQSFEAEDTIKFRGFCFDTNEVYTVLTKNYTIEPDIFDNVSKIITISDLHGRYDLFIDMLFKSKVINKDKQWIFGEGHLVINGDIFDRGAYVTECLWLFYRLEQVAKKAGGAVHILLGNHELMVLRADNRYINEKYMKGIVEVTAMSHESLFSTRSALGQWLRSKHAVIKINDILFTHGGLAPSLVEKNISIQEINNEVRKNIDFARKSPEVSELARYLFGGEGPFWYRGYFYDMEKYSQATSDEIDNILSYFEAKTIVVGHSGMDRISGFYDNRIINEHKTLDSSTTQTLLWENGEFFRILSDGETQLIN